MLVKLADYAKLKKVSPQAIRKAIKDERLVKSISKDGRGYMVDVEMADREWKANTNPSQQRSPQAINIGKQLTSGLASPSYTAARAFGEQYKAKLLELEFREKSGDLVRVDDVKIATFKVNRLFRDSVLNIPIRVVSEISAIIGNVSKEKQHEMQEVMRREINLALEHLADSNGPR